MQSEPGWNVLLVIVSNTVRTYCGQTVGRIKVPLGT